MDTPHHNFRPSGFDVTTAFDYVHGSVWAFTAQRRISSDTVNSDKAYAVNYKTYDYVWLNEELVV